MDEIERLRLVVLPSKSATVAADAKGLQIARPPPVPASPGARIDLPERHDASDLASTRRPEVETLEPCARFLAEDRHRSIGSHANRTTLRNPLDALATKIERPEL